MKLIKGKIYTVTWIDAAGTSEWHTPEELDGLINKYEQGVEQTLMFIKESKHFYAFTSGTHLADENYVDIHLIPKSWAKIKLLK